jgi:hypothetical protein
MPLRKYVRPLVVRYSIRNRHRKARMIRTWLDEHDCRTLLYVGSLGAEDTDANTNIVENELAEGREVVMGINLSHRTTPYPFQVADGRDMPFPDGYVDFSLSNAIIEHVGDEADQRRFVAEQGRVARCWVITTPNRWFPIESHTSAVLRHWSPAWRARRTEFTRLLSLREFTDMLPVDATVVGKPWSPTFTAFYDAAAPRRP